MKELNTLKRFRLNNVIALITILGAGFAILMSRLKFLTLSTSENIIIALLALIAIDSLIERLNILKRIEIKLTKVDDITERLNILKKVELKLNQLPQVSALRKRADVIHMTQFAKTASSIHVLAISGYSIINTYQDFYEKKLKEGCNLKFLLLSPKSQYLDAYKQLNRENIVAVVKNHIDSSLQILVPLTKKSKVKGECQVRVSEIFFPFSLVGIDLGKETGMINVEYHSFKAALDKRPHIIIEKDINPYWFDFYKEQYEQAWLEGKKI